MIAELVNAGYFREITTEGRKTLVLKSPVSVVIKAAVLKQLQAAYPLHEETGGILWAYPANGSLVITRFTILPNQLTGNERKTGYQPASSASVRANALASGALPIRFHSHPVEIYENPYDRQPLTFFQKTSPADRHNSYLPLSIEGYTVVLPDALLSANDRLGQDVRFYLYGGFVAPDSLSALLTSEKVYIYFAILVVLLAYLFGGFRRAGYVFGLAAILSIAVFLLEKRPTGVKNGEGDLVIEIP
ncbi:hypothetical protein [Spirosoma endbachense]|uniref:Uncharacterized protein n=1 Tax=Spirosoma endbachense TaxID=2666025 RepID=A0A6P1VXT8_9BACT|nr:hypothetical protein [Spirosoma endbachense]QHV97575.1 hypothetical protein GJR95_22325 [Spirosoma endbachense]